MRVLYPFLILVMSVAFTTYLSSCKKYIQQQEQKTAESIITNGYWYVDKYLQNDSNITASFSGYLFKFNTDGTVVGTKDSVSTKGTWVENISAYEITSNFPGAGNPLKLLNETWKISSGTSTQVIAHSIDSATSNYNILYLFKQ